MQHFKDMAVEDAEKDFKKLIINLEIVIRHVQFAVLKRLKMGFVIMDVEKYGSLNVENAEKAFKKATSKI